MDTSKLSFGEMVAGVSGALLIIFMFILDWWGYDVSAGGFSASASASAFQWLSFLDIVLFLIGAIAVGAAVARATGNMPSDLPQPPGLIVAGAGALAVLIILFRILIPGDGPAGDLGGLANLDATRKIGAFFGLIAAGGIAFGGWTAMNERASGQAPLAGGQAPPPPPAPPA
jgi:hypothetical protein